MTFLLIAITMLLCSCATAINGKHQVVQIVSEPNGADVVVDGKPVGQTPVAITLPRKQDHSVQITKQGFHHEESNIKRSISPIVLFYLLPGGAISLGADSLTGAHFRFPERVSITLQPLFSPKAVLSNQLTVMKQVARNLWWKKCHVFKLNQL